MKKMKSKSEVRLAFSPSLIGKSSTRASRPNKSVGKIFVPSVGRVTNGVKAAATKSGGKRIF